MANQEERIELNNSNTATRTTEIVEMATEPESSSQSTLSKRGNECELEEFHIPQRFTKSGRKRAIPFPLKLMKVLSSSQYADIIAWTPSGKSFNILKPKAFVSDVLPDEFKSAKYSSFTRKLHRWGFMRHYRGEEAGAFYHKDFQKDRMDLVEEMTCYKADSPKSQIVIVEKSCPKDSTKGHKIEKASKSESEMSKNEPSNTGIASAAGVSKQIPQVDATDRLNAAIELEVNRRLKERLAAAAISRQAFASRQAIALLQAQQLQALMLQKQAEAYEKARFSSLLRLPAVGSDGRPMESSPQNFEGARTA